MKKTQFEKNGGYFIDGVAYMDCKVTGEPVANVSTVRQLWVWLDYQRINPKDNRQVDLQVGIL